jgi:hypothetical protein
LNSEEQKEHKKMPTSEYSNRSFFPKKGNVYVIIYSNEKNETKKTVIGMPLTNDGKIDKRFKCPQVLREDGKRDRRNTLL